MTDDAPASRRELPTDPSGLPPMGSDFEAALDRGLDELGLLDGPAAGAAARASYEAHARLLADWNQAINLTAIREPAEVARRHVVDALSGTATLAASLPAGASLLDLGSGCGYPGLPLAAALPLGRLGLLDSVAKKARFLEVAGAAARRALADGGATAPDVEAIPERAEDLAEESDHRAAWDAVSARAVGSLAEVLELGLPLVREGGLVAAWKREDERDGLRAELRAAGSILRAAGGGRPRVVDVSTTGRERHRLVLVIKERPTPIAYPRPVGVRRKRRR